MRDIDTLRHELKKSYHSHAGKGGWRAVGKEFGIDDAMAWRIVNEVGYEPREPKIRTRLELPAYMEVPVCPICGEVHLKKSCPQKRKMFRQKNLYDWPIDLLKWAIENREEFQPIDQVNYG